jgi:hypothetical protein
MKNLTSILAVLLAGCTLSSDPLPTTQPAPATQTTTTQPATTQPLTFITGVATTIAAATVTTSPAPAAVHVQALNLQSTDWLDEQFHWDFGDPHGQLATDPRIGQTVDLNSALQGPVAAYFYENLGTYTITLHRTLTTGEVRTYQTQVIVPPAHRTVYYIAPDGSDANPGTDMNHPLRSASAAIAKVADHTEFRFQRGGVYPLDSELALKHHDILLDCYGDAAQPLPLIHRAGPILPNTTAPATIPAYSLVFSFWPGLTADVTVRHLRLDTPFTPALTAGQYAYHAPIAGFGNLRGHNVTIADCEFLNLSEGPHGDPTLLGGLFLRNRQIDPLGIPGRTLWLEGSDLVALGNVALNSVNESPLRAAATGIVRGLIAFNDIAQQLDPAHDRSLAKAASTLRTLADVMVVDNRITNGEFSFDPFTAAAQDQRLAVMDNAVFNSFIDIKPNVRHALFQGNTIEHDQGPCITVNAGDGVTMWIEDLRLQNNQGRGWQSNGRMIQINAAPTNSLRQFQYDPANNPYTKIPPPGNP